MTPLFLAPLFSACPASAPTDTSTASVVGSVMNIRVEPSSVTLVTTAGQPATQDFRVVAFLENGRIDSDFPLVEWSLSNTIAGSIDNHGTFTASTENGGKTWVIAEVAGLRSTADVTVIYQEDVVEEGLPIGAETAFEGEAEPAGEDIVWTYPPDGVALPRNLPEMTMMWRDDLGADLYRLFFSSSTTEVSVILATNEWTAPATVWSVITATNRGDDVTVSLQAADVELTDGVVTAVHHLWDAGSISFRVSRFDAEGAIYYWSTTDWGIVRSKVDIVDPQVWFNYDVGPDRVCVGCHVISRTGDRLAYAWASVSEFDVFRVGLASMTEDGAAPSPLQEHTSDRPEGYYSTIDPSGTWRISDNMGVLQVYDARTGEYIKDLEYNIPLTMPDWSPDGKTLVAVSAREFNGPVMFARGYLVTLEHLGDAEFGAANTLLPEHAEYNQYYPTFSPDSKWIAFNRAPGGPYFNADASLWLISAEGGEPIELVNANQGPGLTNSWPRWAPMPDDDVLWLAFASTRDWGNYPVGEGAAQIWVAAIDPSLAEAGQDPSYPAYRLVQQALDTNNHAPWWSYY